jgi:hypothetical protein
MRSLLEYVKELMAACGAGKTQVGTIMVAVVTLLICAAAVAVIGKICPISDYWQVITVVIAVVLAYIVVF